MSLLSWKRRCTNNLFRGSRKQDPVSYALCTLFSPYCWIIPCKIEGWSSAAPISAAPTSLCGLCEANGLRFSNPMSYSLRKLAPHCPNSTEPVTPCSARSFRPFSRIISSVISSPFHPEFHNPFAHFMFNSRICDWNTTFFMFFAWSTHFVYDFFLINYTPYRSYRRYAMQTKRYECPARYCFKIYLPSFYNSSLTLEQIYNFSIHDILGLVYPVFARGVLWKLFFSL